MPRINLAETATLVEAAAGAPTGRKFRARIIEGNIWGSSGYYPAEVLERDGPTAWPAGTHVYLDHPSQSEAFDRPERSVRELAGTIASTPVYEGDGLYADVEVFPDVAPFIESRADAIGMSIRAAATVEQGEADGRTGTIITGIVEGLSVDFVTHAGAGGRIVALLESARPSQVVQRAIARGVAEATANDTRDALQSALRDTFTGERVYVWVRDFDDTHVWYEHEDPDGSGTYQLGYSLADDGSAVLAGDPVEVNVRTVYVPAATATSDASETRQLTLDVAIEQYSQAMREALQRGLTAPPSVPVPPAGQPITQESEEDTMPQIEEARLRQLEEAAGRVQTLESERDTAVTERDQARDERDQLRESVDAGRARELATTAASEAGVELDEYQLAGITNGYPRGDDGRIDEAAFTTRASEAIAKLAERAGTGRVRNLGATTGPTTKGEAVSEADLDALDDAVFGEIKEA